MSKLSVFLASSILCSALGVFAYPNEALAQTAEDREFVESIIKHKVRSDEDLMIWLVILSDMEGNYDTISKVDNLQKYFASHKARNAYRQGWCAAKYAQYALLRGQTEIANKQASKAISLMNRMPDPMFFDSGFFYTEGLEVLYKTLFKLKRQQDGMRALNNFNTAKQYLGEDDAIILAYLAIGSILLDDPKSAKGFCEASLKKDTDYCVPHYIRAIVDFEDNHIEKAKEHLNKALLICSNFSSAHSFLGSIELEQGHPDQALVHFDKAIALGGSIERPLALRGATLAIKKEYDKSIADLTEVLKTYKDSWAIYATRGGCYLELRRFEEALQDLNQSITLLEKIKSKKTDKFKSIQAILYFERGVCYDNVSKPDKDKALADLNKAIELDPSNAEVFKQRGVLRLAMGDQLGVSDYDQYSKLSMEEENSDFADKQGKAQKLSLAKRQKDAEAAKGKAAKPSWISEAAPSSSAEDKVAGSSITAPSRTVNTVTGKLGTDGSSTGSAEPEKQKDSYLSYFENKLVQVRSIKPGTPSEKGDVRIEADGVPVLLDKGESTKLLNDLLMRAAPFKQPPADKPSVVDVEFYPSDGTIKVQFQTK